METSYPARDRIEYIIAFINEFGKGFYLTLGSDPATALFKEGPAYIYSYLKDELSKGKI